MKKVYKNYRITIYSRRGKVNRKVMAFEFPKFDNPEFDRCFMGTKCKEEEITMDDISGVLGSLFHEWYMFFKDVPGYENWTKDCKNTIDCLEFIRNNYHEEEEGYKFILSRF